MSSIIPRLCNSYNHIQFTPLDWLLYRFDNKVIIIYIEFLGISAEIRTERFNYTASDLKISFNSRELYSIRRRITKNFNILFFVEDKFLLK